ncbi:MAG: hypothetical protein HYS17_06875 [Micavibrio aeruginosavorus]|uniref:DUF3718 domain-containing protein n=1 Tax=Micavibrio aeruginosavorus TaxID=349221 RepID=A0A7T5UFX8_9BACT|nr:MAG: hypothetical protein HYS17_06875 [Micavibrio aeruginosavorus]
MSGFLKKTAIALTTALAAATAHAQPGLEDASVREVCEALGQSPALQTFSTNRGKVGFAQNERLGCKYEFGLDQQAPLLTKIYNLRDTKQVIDFTREVGNAQRSADRATAEEKRRQERMDKYRDRGIRAPESRPAAQPAPVLKDRSAGPGRTTETLEELRARRHREAGMPAPKQ